MSSKLVAYSVGGAAVAGAKGASAIGSLAAIWLLNQVVGKDVFGTYAAVTAVVFLTGTVSLAGLDRTILFKLSRIDEVSEYLAGKEFVGSVMRIVLKLSLIAALLLAVSASFIEQYISLPELSFWIVALAFLVPITCADKVFAAWYQSRQRVAEAVLIPSTTNICRALFLAFVLFAWPTPIGASVAVVCAALVPVGLWLSRPPQINLSEPNRLTNLEWSYGLKMMMTTLTRRGLSRIDLFMISVMTTGALTADYAVAAQLGLLTGAGNILFRPIFMARMGRQISQKRIKEFRREYEENRFAALSISLLGTSAYILFGPQILNLFGNYEAAHSVLVILCVHTLIGSGFGANGQYLNMAGHAGWSLAITLFVLITNIGLNIVLIPQLGAQGAALATFVTTLSSNLIISFVIWRFDNITTITVKAGIVISLASCLALLAAFNLLNIARAALYISFLAAIYIGSEKKYWWRLIKR